MDAPRSEHAADRPLRSTRRVEGRRLRRRLAQAGGATALAAALSLGVGLAPADAATSNTPVWIGAGFAGC